jgi:hypothetical protein
VLCILSKKKLSGAQNRKRKAAKDAAIQKQSGTLAHLIKKVKNTSDLDCSQLDTSSEPIVDEEASNLSSSARLNKNK